MRSSHRALKRLLIAVVMVAVTFGAATSAASAASFSPAGPVNLSGTLTWKLDGGTPTSCTFNGSGSAAAAWMGQFSGSCSNGSAATGHLLILPTSPTTVGVVQGIGFTTTPFSTYGGTLSWHAGGAVPFTNGDATTPTSITFSDTYIGFLGYSAYPVTVSGSLDVTTPAGGLVTISY